MSFQEAERAYQDLRAQYSAGKLSNTDFENEVSKLKVQDAEGRWWQIGVQSGDWYVHDGQKWAKAKPPIHGTPAVVPSAPPEAPAASSAPAASTPAATPPPPGPSGSTTAPASPPVTPPGKAPGGGRLAPRFFSAAPAGRGGGNLPTPVLFGIIGIVALIGIAIIVAAFLLVSGQLKGTTGTPTRTAGTAGTPTLAAVVGPTIAQATLPPLATNTPIPLPTSAATAAITPTVAVTPTTAPVTATTAAARPTATKKPAATTAAPAATATKAPNVPPGVYVTKVRTDPAVPQFNVPTTFYVTFFNNSGSSGPSAWQVKIFKCEAACTGSELADNKSIGETPKSSQTIPAGTSELAVGPWVIGLGGCNYVASPYYVNDSGVVVPFPTQDGNRLYYNFKMCSQ